MRVPMKGMLCGWCGKPVTRHNNAVEEKVPWPSAADPQQLRKQLWHKKRCWSKEVRSRLDSVRAEKQAEREREGVLVKEAMVGLAELDQKAVELAREFAVREPTELFNDARIVSTDELLREEHGMTARRDGSEKTKRGDLMAAVRLAIEARKGKWWTRAEIKKQVEELGISNSERDSIGQAIIVAARETQAERRVLDGHTLEYRVVATESVASLPPLMPKPYEPKVGKQVEERHSTRPGPWQKPLTVMPFDGRAPVEEVVHSIVEEAGMSEPMNGKVSASSRVRNAMFVLKSEKMLNDLERNLTAMVREAVETTRQAIEKLVEEELE
jgi:hypothetical protein